MDISRTYKNHSLESKRKLALDRIRADELLRRNKDRGGRPIDEIERARRDKTVGSYSRALVKVFRRSKREVREKLYRLLVALASKRSRLVEDTKYLLALRNLATKLDLAVREPESWNVPGYNADRQLASLMRHLYTQYPMPAWFDSVWQNEHEPKTHRWYVQVGLGMSLRMLDDLPFPLTKRMAHFAMQAPANLKAFEALRWGQARGLDGTVRLADAVVGALGAPQRGHESFWLTVLQFLAANPMLDPRQVGPIVDYIRSRRFEAQPLMVVNGRIEGGQIPEPNFSMKGRTVTSLLRQVDQWHRQLASGPRGMPNLAWLSCGIAGMQRIEGSPPDVRVFTIRELLTSADLFAEGQKLRHCVGSYSHSCQRGRCAIYSLRLDEGRGEERLVTIEVVPAQRRIVQARGKLNRFCTPVEQRVVRAWAIQCDLEIASHVMPD